MLESCSSKEDELKIKRATLVEQQKAILDDAGDLLSINEVEQARQTTRVKKNMLNAINGIKDKALLIEIVKKVKKLTIET